jgi:hypothetical protein
MLALRGTRCLSGASRGLSDVVEPVALAALARLFSNCEPAEVECPTRRLPLVAEDMSASVPEVGDFNVVLRLETGQNSTCLFIKPWLCIGN